MPSKEPRRPQSTRVLALFYYPIAAGVYALMWWWRPPTTCQWGAYMSHVCTPPNPHTVALVSGAYVAAGLAAAWYPALWLYRAWRRRPARRP